MKPTLRLVLQPDAQPDGPRYVQRDMATARSAAETLMAEATRIRAILSGSYVASAVEGRLALHEKNARDALDRLRRAR